MSDAKSIIDNGRMSAWQWAAVMVTVGLNALDGFDVLSISFASPGIAKDWGVDKAALGWVLSMELIGMAVGSVVLGGVADRIGRRPTILGCLVAMTIGMWFAGHATGISDLLAWRLLTGLGIGGMLASTNAAAAEFSNNRWRSLAMALMVIGYPIGGVLGGLIVQQVLGAGGTWRDIFEIGAIATALFIPIVFLLLPETPAFLDRKQPSGALQKANATLRRFGLPDADMLSAASDGVTRTLGDIFRPGLLATTLLITFAYFAHITSFYFMIKWVPKIVVDMGFEPKAAAGILTWANLGGATGGALFGLVAMRVGLKPLTIVTLLFGAALIIWFGAGADGLDALRLKVAAAGFFTNAGIAGLYLLVAKVFPTHVRGTGTGFVIGVGRGGAALAPIIAGYLFQAGLALQVVAAIMAMGSLIGAITLLALKENAAD